MIDESLTCDAQVEHITTKVNSGLNILRKLPEIVDNNTLTMVFKSIVQTYFDYCAQIWGSLFNTLSNQLRRLQNRAVRIIPRQGYNVRLDEILKSFGFPNLQQPRILQLLLLMYKFDQKLAPTYFIEIFTNINQIHDHDTHQSQ